MTAYQAMKEVFDNGAYDTKSEFMGKIWLVLWEEIHKAHIAGFISGAQGVAQSAREEGFAIPSLSSAGLMLCAKDPWELYQAQIGAPDNYIPLTEDKK